MRLIKGDKIIKATQRAYDVIYKREGYVPYEEDVGKTSNVGKYDEINYDEITKAEIIAKLEDLDIEHSPSDNKPVLFDLLRGER